MPESASNSFTNGFYMDSLKVLFVSQEVDPFAKTGPLAKAQEVLAKLWRLWEASIAHFKR
jgi:hypothetical protein